MIELCILASSVLVFFHFIHFNESNNFTLKKKRTSSYRLRSYAYFVKNVYIAKGFAKEILHNIIKVMPCN